MFQPNYQFNSILDITVSFLQENGITALLLDVDNTIITFKGNRLISGFKLWKEKIEKAGIKLIILSNGKPNRLSITAKKAELDFIALALKPLPFKYLLAAKKLGVKRNNVAVVGDQVFTDILGGKLAKIKTILLNPIKPETEKSFIIRRKLEQKLKAKWERV